MDALHGEVSYQSGVSAVEALVLPVGNHFTREHRTPHSHLVDVACEAFSDKQPASVDGRHMVFRHGLHIPAVNVDDGAGAPSHVECQMVPLVVVVVGFRQQEHLCRLAVHLAHSRVLEGGEGHHTVFIAQAESVVDLQQGGILVGFDIIATEPELQCVVVCVAGCERCDVDLEWFAVFKVRCKVAVVDIPTLCRQHHVTRTNAVHDGRAVSFIHFPMAHKSGGEAGLRLLVCGIKVMHRFLDVPDGQVVHPSHHAVSSDMEFSCSTHGGYGYFNGKVVRVDQVRVGESSAE